MSWIAESTTADNDNQRQVKYRDTKRGWSLTLDLLRVRRAGVMRVDLLRGRALVKRDKAVQEVVTRGIVVLAAVVVGEVVTKR